MGQFIYEKENQQNIWKVELVTKIKIYIRELVF